MGSSSLYGWVAPTHLDWFDFLAQRREWPEVNFWRPSDFHAFRGVPGSPFFFKLKAPRSRIGGFGFVASFSRLPEWLAWDCFGEANGAQSLEVMQSRLRAIRKKSELKGRSALRQIGCIVILQATFFSPDEWIDQPRDWPKSNLVPMRYDLQSGEGLRVWRECQERLGRPSEALGIAVRETGDRWGEPTLVRPRLGQGAFRVAVTDAYSRSCAVTGEHSLPALEAAHIRPYADGGTHEVSNGLLLRSDLHRLFDRGYVTVEPAGRLLVSSRLRDHFSNGRSYYPLDQSIVARPQRPEHMPNAELLKWHNDVVFQK